MADVKCIAPTRIGGTEITYAQGMRAGSWLFFTGHMASDFEHGLAAVGRRQARASARQPAALSPRRRLHHRSLCQADRRRGRRPSPYRARRSVLPGRAGGECVSACPQGGAQGIRAAQHVGADGRTAGRGRQHGRLHDRGSARRRAHAEAGAARRRAGAAAFRLHRFAGLGRLRLRRRPDAEQRGDDRNRQAGLSAAQCALERHRYQAADRVSHHLAAQARARGRRQLAQERDQGAGLSHQYRRPAGIPRRLERSLRRPSLRAHGGGDQGSCPGRVDPGDQYLRLARQRQDQEADRRPQGIAAHAAGPRGGARRRSPVLVGALRRRRRWGHPAGARHGRLEIFRGARASRDAGDPDGGRRDSAAPPARRSRTCSASITS